MLQEVHTVSPSVASCKIIYKLSTNMRVLMTDDLEAGQFEDFLMLLGDGSPPVIEQSDVICLCRFGTCVKPVDEFIQSVSPDCRKNYQDTMALGKSNISSPQMTVTGINAKMSHMVPVQPLIYRSIIKAAREEDPVHYPSEFVNSIHFHELPAHVLFIKVDIPVMLMSSLNPLRLIMGPGS